MSAIKYLFWNRRERRLRSFWRILATGLFIVIASFIVAIVCFGLVPFEFLAMGLASWATMGVILTSTIGAGLLLDHRHWQSFGFRLSWQWLLDLAFGMVMGFLLICGIVGLQVLLGFSAPAETASRIDAQPSYWLQIGSLVVLFISVGVYEEVAFRGYLFKNLAESWNFRSTGPCFALFAATAFTALVFGVLHAMNPNSTLVGVLNTALVGLFLAQALMMTGELALPIGYHITWNMTQSVVFGLPVSGLNVDSGLFPIESIGPEWATGGSYGIEGGLFCSVSVLFGMLLVALWARYSRGSCRVDLRLATLGQASKPDPSSDSSGDRLAESN